MRTKLTNAVIYAIYLLVAAFLVTGMFALQPVEARRGCPNPWAMAEHFGTTIGNPGYVARFDLNGDGAVTVGDIILAINCWLEGTP